MPTALVVEDEADIQRLISTLLEEHGFEQVLCARTAKEALDLASANALDLVVLDHYLAEGFGPEVADQLRALPSFEAPLLMTTALPRAQAQRVCDEARACDCVVKPFDIDEFLAAVDACLREDTPAAA